jgi:hypothetical protein
MTDFSCVTDRVTRAAGFSTGAILVTDGGNSL